MSFFVPYENSFFSDVYLVGHDWTDDSLGVYYFPATADVVGAWQYAVGSAMPTATGAHSTATVKLEFNHHSGLGTKQGVLNAQGSAITGSEAAGSGGGGVGSLAGWTKRTGISGGGISQRFPANNLDSYRNVQYAGAGCKGSGHVDEFGLTAGCPHYGSAGAQFAYNYSSGNLTIHVFDGSDCPCGQHTPINPWNGGGGDCTCPASRCATNATHYLQYHALVGMNESTAPCAPVVPETAQECGTGTTTAPCRSQKWFPTPVADKAACSHELSTLCSAEKAQGARQCQACAGIAGHWNKLRIVGCTDLIVAGLCTAVFAA